MKLLERLTDEEDWYLDSRLSGCKGSINSPELMGDIPADGYPATFNTETAKRILGYLSDIEVLYEDL